MAQPLAAAPLLMIVAKAVAVLPTCTDLLDGSCRAGWGDVVRRSGCDRAHHDACEQREHEPAGRGGAAAIPATGEPRAVEGETGYLVIEPAVVIRPM
jgi:hypothetical protein